MSRRDETPPAGNGSADGASDGPWRVATSCVIGITADRPPSDRDADLKEPLAAGLRQSGIAVSSVVILRSLAELVTAVDNAARGCVDLLLLDADIDLDPAAAMEMRRVASSDPMIAGVSALQETGGANALDHRRRILPAVTYAPLGDPRCLYLKGSVLAEARAGRSGLPIDWDAFALTVNAWGFRMALANHAVYRCRASIAAPPSLVERGMRLEADFPGTKSAVAAFLSGTPKVAERLIEALATNGDGRRTVIFDLTHVGTKRSGTGEVAVALIRRAAEAWAEDWVVAVLASAATYAFHFGVGPSAAVRIDPTEPTAGAAFIRIGQPFSWKEIDAAVTRAPALVFFMLDTIGLDCIRLAPDDLDALWRFVLAEADGMLFNSAFTQRQYERRFGRRACQTRLASLHSLDCRDYVEQPAAEAGNGSLLIVGNAFAHKRVEDTARALAGACPGRAIVAIGLPRCKIAGVIGYPSGVLDDATIASLYQEARLVIYPSVYEGFGFPLVEALAHRRPVLVRDLAPFAEIAAGIPESANIHRFSDDRALIALVMAPPRWTEVAGPSTARRWDDAVADLRGVLDQALSSVDYNRVLRRIDFMRGRLAFVRQKPFDEHAGLAEDLDRIAALVGRLGSKAIHRLAALPGAGTALRQLFRVGRRSGRGP